MTQEASAELLEIENKISKVQERIERIEDLISEKWDVSGNMTKGVFESDEKFYKRFDQAEEVARNFERAKTPELNTYRQELKQLEGQKQQLNQQLFAGLDESDDF